MSSDSLVARARADLAGRLAVDAAEIALVSMEDVTWPDGSLGCPQPGMLYPQVLTAGTRIVLESGGARYAYHSDRRRDPFLCERPATSSRPSRGPA